MNTPGDSRASTINGLPQSSINITIDGVSAQDNFNKTTDGFFARVSPRLDAVEEVTVSTAAQGSATTGQGAVQIQFVTRSGSNQFTGSSYYYLQHYKFNANTWFNNRDLPPDPLTGKAAKSEDVLHQPGTRVGGPIIIPGLWNGRDKAFFFVNYEESRSPGQNAENRLFLHPRTEQGWFRYNVSGQLREINVLDVAARSGFLSSVDPTVARLLADIRESSAQGGVTDVPDPLQQQLRYQYDADSTTRYPSVRLDFNLTDKHRLSGSYNGNRLLSSPDTTNNGEPPFPGFPGVGNQHSTRYNVQATLRSTLGANLVNEFRVGGSGGGTLFSPEVTPAQFGGTSVADQAGFLLDINGDFLGIANAHQSATTASREASTKLIENTLSWIKGSHNIQMGGSFTRADVWLKNQTQVPTIQFGINSNDAAESMFSGGNARTNFPGASNAQLSDARELYATLVGRVNAILGNVRLNGIRRLRLSRREPAAGAPQGLRLLRRRQLAWKPNFTVNMGLRYELQSPFYPLNDSYSTATIADVWGRSGVNNLFMPGTLTGKTPEFILYDKGVGAYDTDLNNFAPSLGFAWTVGGSGGFLKKILGNEAGDSVLRAGYALGYNRQGMTDFVGAIDDNPGIALNIDRNHTRGNLGVPGSDSPAQPWRPRAAVVPDDARVSDDGRDRSGHPHLRSEPPGAVRADVDGRLAAQAHARHGHRGPVRRHALAPVVDRIQLQRDQHRRERVPERVPCRAGQPAGQRSGGWHPCRIVRLLRSRKRHIAAADLPGLLQRCSRFAGW